MLVEQFLSEIHSLGISFYTGVPDSLLSPLSDALYAQYGLDPSRHLIAANEGNAVGLAAGHYLATGNPALVYMQNSGIGNTINPIASLLHGQVYAIPCLFVIGWRGEPGVHDEPQHKFQGTVTVELMELMDVQTFILDKNCSEEELRSIFRSCHDLLSQRKCAAIIVKKGALTSESKGRYRNEHPMSRERALEIVLQHAEQEDIFVSTTGKVSRELFELREAHAEDHRRDFLTVGSMGHALMIALGIAAQKNDRTIWCVDGDGAALMHLGGMEITAKAHCANLIHIVMNNGAHESVGGMPVAGGTMDLSALARAAGYNHVFCADDEVSLKDALEQLHQTAGTRFLEIKVALGARADLGRPTTTPQENLAALREFIS